MIDIQSLLKEFDGEIVEQGKAYYHDGRVVELKKVFPGEYHAKVAGSEDYEVRVALIGEDRGSFDCNCPYWDAPFCKHVVAVLLAIEAQEVCSNASLVEPSAKDAPSSGLPLAALSKEQLMRLLQELATAFPETRGWMKARIVSSGDAIQAYQRLIRESAAPFEKRDYIRYRDMPRALRGAESALDYLMKMEEGSDVTQNIDFCWMVISETMRILDNGDDSDGRAGGVIEKCVEYLEKLWTQHVLPSDNQAREKYFAQLLGKLQTHALDNEYEWNVRVVEQCARIADLIPSLRERLLQYQRGRLDAAEMKDKAIRACVRGVAQKDYYHMLLRWQGRTAAMAYASAHMENDFFRKQFIEEYTQQKQFDKAVALCLAAEQACGSSRVSSHEWQKRRYDIYDKAGDVDAQRQAAETLLLEGYSEYYGCLHKLYAAGQWPKKREELLERLSGLQPLAYLEIITEEADKPRLIAYLREKPFAVFRLYPHLLPDYAGEVREIFLCALRGCAAHASDRRDYQDVCRKIGAFAKAFGNEAAAEIVREMQRSYPRKPAFQDELKKCRLAAREDPR